MYARVGHGRMEGDLQKLREDLKSTLIPRIQQASGAIEGFWLEPIEGHGMAILLFETREAAESSQLPQPGQQPMPGVTVERVEVREVIGNFAKVKAAAA